jgi:hypothetical protein
MVAPDASRMGAPESAIWRSWPSRASRAVVGQAHDHARAHHLVHGVFRCLAGAGVDDAEDLGQGASQGLARGPAGQFLGHPVHAPHPALHVRGDDRVADGIQRHPLALLLLRQDGQVLLASAEEEVQRRGHGRAEQDRERARQRLQAGEGPQLPGLGLLHGCLHPVRALEELPKHGVEALVHGRADARGTVLARVPALAGNGLELHLLRQDLLQGRAQGRVLHGAIGALGVAAALEHGPGVPDGGVQVLPDRLDGHRRVAGDELLEPEVRGGGLQPDLHGRVGQGREAQGHGPPAQEGEGHQPQQDQAEKAHRSVQPPGCPSSIAVAVQSVPQKEFGAGPVPLGAGGDP